MTWSRERTNLIRNMWLDGKKIGPIAVRLEVSKQAAYSKIQRMKLPLRYKVRKSIPLKAGEQAFKALS